MERLHSSRDLEKIRRYAQSKATASCWHRRVKTPVGWIDLVADEVGLRVAQLENNAWDYLGGRNLLSGAGCKILDDTEQQLGEYFAGQRRQFSIPLQLHGTDFQKRVWQELLKIPYGQYISYGTQAARIGHARAVRAVGATNGRNSIAILVPCHRVLGASGGLTGYAGGIEVKRKLLALEGIRVKD